MGLGTSKYRKVMRTPQSGENAGKKLWYATAVSDREMSFEDFVTHISEHNSPYSRGTIHGVLMDTLDCLKELILDGKSVRLSDLGLFSIGMTSRGEETREKVTAASVQGVHLIVRNTKNWSNAELKKLTKIVAYDEYVAGEGGGTSGKPGGGSSSGDTTQGVVAALKRVAALRKVAALKRAAALRAAAEPRKVVAVKPTVAT